MSVPDLIPIRYEPDYRTRTIGRCEGGQFLASVTAAFPEVGTDVGNWQAQKRWFAVLHRFDDAGRHLDSRIHSTGTTADGEKAAVEAARALLADWLDALPGRAYGDIAIAPFAVRVEGSLFGLVIETDEEDETDGEEEEEGEDGEGGVWAELYPDGLGFHAPWDGCYDT
ncbi:hypothetical protein [Kitasatospora sp. NPDC091276]|uniref:hypothetical protein n=1 Tax=Kitasatospora sp. NPDC091276 TaxID=3155300 RepID=UPI003422C31C